MKHVLVAITLVATMRSARADPAVAALAFFGGGGATVVLGLNDIFGHPDSKLYGGVEVGVGLPSAAVNFAIATVIDQECGGCNVMFYGMAALNTAVAIHGIYLLTRHESAAPTPLSFSLGSIRAHVAPTTVGSGRSAITGLGVSGTF